MIFEVLKKSGRFGAENAIHAPALAALVGIPATSSGQRKMRKMIELERTAHKIILSDSNGYYLPSLDSTVARMEVERYYCSNLGKMGRVYQRLRPVQKALSKQVDGQTSFLEME